jgi:hypothetical protein
VHPSDDKIVEGHMDEGIVVVVVVVDTVVVVVCGRVVVVVVEPDEPYPIKLQITELP